MADEDKKKPDLMELVRTRYKKAMEFDEDNRAHALECLKFRNLEQWDAQVKSYRMTDPEGARPCPVMDKTNQYLNQVINDYRQNRPSIKVRPVDDKGDPEVAKILQGIIRHIENRSNAAAAYDSAYEQAVDGGFGYFRILTEYCDEMSFDQDLLIKRIKNRFQVALDPDRQEADGSDAKWGFIVEKMQRKEYEKQYPKADKLDFATDGKIYSGWLFDDYVIIAEYFYIEPKQMKLCMYQSGRVVLKEKDAAKEDYEGDPIIQERVTTINKVMWKKINAKEVLEERDWLGKHIPIIEIIGTELDIEGKSIKSGLLKPAMEPQRLHNYAVASYVEGVAMAPRASWVAAEGQIQGHEELYRTANRRSISVLPYKPVVMEGGVPVPPPMRVDPPGLSAGWLQTMQNTEHDIQASMGTYSNTILGQGDANSGKQELLQQRRGDTATFHYSDNAARALRYAGAILIDLIPKLYDQPRVVRILGEDGEPDQAQIDPSQAKAVTEVQTDNGIQKIYNLNVGKYDVEVTTGPSFLTKRLEATEFLTAAAQAAKDPVTNQVLTYLAVKNNDWAGADEASGMLKKLLPPQVIEPEEGQGPMVQTPEGPISVEEAAQAIGGLMQAREQMGMQLQGATEALKKAGADKQANEAEKLRIEDYKAKTERMEAENDAARQEAEFQAKQQQEQQEQIAKVEGHETDLAALGQVAAAIAAPIAQAVSEAITAAAMVPRETVLMVDEQGNPVGSVSTPQGVQ